MTQPNSAKRKTKPANNHRDGYERIVYIFQGGGALGAFQAGAYKALLAAGYRPDWICGISIGAINSAIIAGNREQDRLPRLEAFWNSIAVDTGFWQAYQDINMPKIHNMVSSWWSMMAGITNFYTPKWGNPWLVQSDTPDNISFYDTSPLRKTLGELIDFDYLNERHVRLSLGAVDIEDGRLVYFDNHKHELTVDHILASGALPPGFPAVKIDGRYYWDGGLYSNSPLNFVLDECVKSDTLCFMVDNFSAAGVLPHSLDGIMEREKDIRFASRSRRRCYIHNTQHNLRLAIAKLAELVPKEQRNKAGVKEILSLGHTAALHIAHIIYHSPAGTELNSKDYDFSRSSINRRISDGYQHTESLLATQRNNWIEDIKDSRFKVYTGDEETHYAI